MLQPMQGDLQELPDSGWCKLSELADALDVEHGSVDVRVRVASIAQEQEIAEELGVLNERFWGLHVGKYLRSGWSLESLLSRREAGR